MSKMMLYVFTPNVSSSCASPLPGMRADSRRFADRDDGLTFDLLGTCTFTHTVACFTVILYPRRGSYGGRGGRPPRAPGGTDTFAHTSHFGLPYGTREVEPN